MTFVFCHVGPDAVIPTILVRSLRRHNPGAVIVQCSDEDTQDIPEADETIRVPDAGMMAMRLRGFAEVEGPAMFLDADMICRKPINVEALLGDNDVMVCRRSRGNAAHIRPRGLRIDVSEYWDRTYGDVYPYLACTTIASAAFWRDCLANLRTLDAKFQDWFGDQEAIRNVVNAGEYKVGELSERDFAFTPDMTQGDPAFIHFKGRHKHTMIGTAILDGLIDADLARIS